MMTSLSHLTFAPSFSLFHFSPPQGETEFIAELVGLALESNGPCHDQKAVRLFIVGAGHFDQTALHQIQVKKPLG